MKRRRLRVAAVFLCLGLAGLLGVVKLMTRWSAHLDEVDQPPAWAGSARDPDPPSDLVMLAYAPPTGDASLLEREIARQAMLIAARDELGLRTRDAHLRELDRDAPGLPEPLMANLTIREGQAHFVVARDLKAMRDGVSHTAAIADSGQRIPQLVQEAESLSRGGFVDTLAHFGYRKASSATPENGARASDPDSDLTSRFDLVSQYAAVRGWHAAIQGGGETPARLAGLVCGYANLGLLTAHHWSPASKAYQARALLYAERLLNRTGPTPESLRWRAYARMLAGLPAAAGQDLEQAAADGREEAATPGWVPVLEARVRGDAGELDRLGEAGTTPDRALARLLRLQEAEATDCAKLADESATAVLDLEPACARALDSLLTRGSFAAQGSAQQAALDGATAWLYRPLTRSGLPLELDVAPAGRSAEQESKLREKLLGDLVSTGKLRDDRSEPSLYSFGRLIEEEGFYQAWRVVEFDRSVLSVNADDLIARTKPWSPHHPYRPYIESLAWGGAGRPRLTEVAARLNEETLVPAVWPMRDSFLVEAPEPAARDGFGTRWKGYHDYVVLENRDDVVGDLVWWIGKETTEVGRRLFTKTLEAIDPASAGTATRLARHGGSRVDARLADWEVRFSHDPTLLRAVAERHIEAERYGDAERCLQASTAISPEPRTFARLAKIRLAAGDESGCLEALHGPLRQPDSGLDHADACRRIAEFYMRRGRWREAEPYAERAAAAFSAWGLQCAAECREGLGDYDGAEEMIRAISQRYDENAEDWYWWCLVTGRGDLAEAGRVAKVAVANWDQAVEGEYGADARLKRAMHDYVEGQSEAALERLRSLSDDVKLRAEGYYPLFAALVADEMGLVDIRDQLLDAAIRRGVEHEPSIGHVARTLRADLDGGRLDPGAVRRAVMLLNWTPGEVTNAEYFVARYLENRGRTDEALPLYESAAASPQRHKVTCPLAAVAVRRLGGSVPTRRLHEVDADMTEALEQLEEGRAYGGALRYAAALRRFEASLRLVPGHAPSLQSRSLALLYQDRAAEALPDVEAAAAVQPGRKKLAFDRARVLECLGRNAEAAAVYEKVLASDPTPEEAFAAHNNLCWLYASCSDPAFRDPEAAMRHAKAMELSNDITLYDPNDWSVRARAMAVALAATGQYEEAAGWAGEALKSMQRIPESVRPSLEYQIACYSAGRPYVRPDRWWMRFQGDDPPELLPARSGPVEAPRPPKPR